ncbi:MAG: hypothetical protein JNN07_20830 [Verrucomicrobiales bacterium]|nr:hypothetical protein [Verrucomicrobiales bacterium]
MKTSQQRMRSWVLGVSVLAIGSALAQDPADTPEVSGDQTDAPPPGELAPASPSEQPADGAPAAPPNDNPFRRIVERNAFALLPPPPPPPQDAPPPPPPPPPITVKLTGLTDLRGKKKAYLVLTEQGPNKQPKYVSLTEGEATDNVEVLTIDIGTKFVKINNNGQFTNMTFAKIEAGPATPPPGGLPGQPGFNPPGGPRIPGVPQPNLNAPNPAAVNGAGNAALENSGSVIIGGGGDNDVVQRPGGRGRVFVSDSGASSAQPTSYGNSGAVSYNTGVSTSGGGIPTRDTRTPASATAPTPRPDRRGMVPRFEIPHLEPPIVPTRQTATGQ